MSYLECTTVFISLLAGIALGYFPNPITTRNLETHRRLRKERSDRWMAECARLRAAGVKMYSPEWTVADEIRLHLRVRWGVNK